MTKLEEIKAYCGAAPLYPYKKWPVAFVQYPEVNEMLDFGLSARTDLPRVVAALEVAIALIERLDNHGQVGCKAMRCSASPTLEEIQKILGGSGE